ncbi:SDR family NAD(P)-dependent oxidoreductase [Streptomyces sp. NPDC059786]|uniref:SDR family NAD(P)-dependent oxidoreductase n=1 Tax=Streptomyces sp. NPDC059786 TaxID=3346946 RepID=UPI0036659510
MAVDESSGGAEPRVAVVTGAGRGIGKAVAAELAARGFRIVLADVDGTAVHAAATELGARARAVTVDLRHPDAAAVLARAAVSEFGRLDVWVNNAGVLGDGPFADELPELSAHMVDVNLGAVLAGCRAAWTAMREHGGGHIVNVASACALKPLAGLATYSATKAAVLALSEALRREGRRATGPRVSAVLPYVVDTAAGRGLGRSLFRPLRPREVAVAVARVVQRPRARSVVPRRMGWVLAAAGLLPERVRDSVDDLLGVDALALDADTPRRTTYRDELAARAHEPPAAPHAGHIGQPQDAPPPRDLPQPPDESGQRPSPAVDERLAPAVDEEQGLLLAAAVERLYPVRPGAELTAELLAVTGPPLGSVSAARLDRRLHQAMVAPVRHLLEGGGRRWRPLLMASVIEALGQDGGRYGELMAACELMHTGSLLIDDIQDGAELRRGRPAGHLVHGTAPVITAGTAAYFSMDRAVRRALPADPALRTAVYEAYLGAVRAAHAGQALDLQGHHEEMAVALKSGDNAALLELLTLTHRLKSGAPVASLFLIGATVGGATPAQREALAALGSAVGTAYQITDDVADLTGVRNRGVLTKRRAEDLLNAKVTYPLAWAVALLPRQEMRALWTEVVAGLDEDSALRAAKRIEACGALDRCTREADRLLEEAWTAVAGLLPASPARERLEQLCSVTVQRHRIA